MWASASTAAKSQQWHAAAATRTSSTALMSWRCRCTEYGSPSRSSCACPFQRLYFKWTEISCRSSFSTWSQCITLRCCRRHRNWLMKYYRRTLRSTRFMVSWGALMRVVICDFSGRTGWTPHFNMQSGTNKHTHKQVQVPVLDFHQCRSSWRLLSWETIQEKQAV